ncbi:hypothetical protein WICMUC_002565 [Wickerhamomyces mucosus]|uniref:2-deoxy-D-gluconate 3-dehydrogenase n=1 Tax=Wickerhamomyces mucosus TaxID=1378264 RepID=A0A9P8TDN0_9ASCO|nr:hypothetical protein WICMUC_002565 [Wickerhamomyces mucosus]
MSAELFSLKGKVVVITGATRGIGEGMVTGLAEAGAEIILVHRGATDPSRVVDKLTKIGAKVHTIAAELENSDEVKRILPEALKKSSTGKVDVLVNNAGITHRDKVEDYPDEEWDRVINVNLTSLFKLARAFGKYWISNNLKGKIINTASLYSFFGGLNVAAYTASKGAVHSLTQALSNEWVGKGINVNSIVPGFIKTDMTDGLKNNPDRLNFVTSRIPVGEFGKPEDFKGPVVFLASAASDYISGSSTFVDGGYTAN